MLAVEVIDLTSPANSVIVIDDDSHDTNNPTSTNNVPLEKSPSKKKRRKRAIATAKQEGAVDDGSNLTHTPPSGIEQKDSKNSQPRGQKRKREKDKETSKSKPVNTDTPSLPLFTIDTAGHPLGDQFQTSHSSVENSQKVFHIEEGLLLPPHVSVTVDVTAGMNGGAEETGNRPLSPISDASGIDFLDDALGVGVPRYFVDTTAPKTYKTCKRCGDNDHDFKDCPNTICLTCGARNEHNSRSCPILRYCFNCQGKGHLAKDCPRIGPTDGRRNSSHDCHRCGSPRHHTTNCPTLWRIYTYLTDNERDKVLAERAAKQDLTFDEGGEGFIARDHWCYNCGQSGHLGDDCREGKFNFDKPEDYSAFGRYNCLTGPFASSSQSPRYERAPRPWELNEPTRGGIPLDAQENIGRKGREKARKRAAEAQSRLEEEDPDDDVPDWFNRSRRKANDKPYSNSRKEPQPGPSEPKRPPLLFRITSERQDPRFDHHKDGSRPSLLNRIDMKEEEKIGGSRSRDKFRNRERNRNRDKDRDSDRKRGNQPNHHHPNERRWRGGYDR